MVNFCMIGRIGIAGLLFNESHETRVQRHHAGAGDVGATGCPASASKLVDLHHHDRLLALCMSMRNSFANAEPRTRTGERNVGRRRRDSNQEGSIPPASPKIRVAVHGALHT
jgi:hypothetical protein